MDNLVIDYKLVEKALINNNIVLTHNLVLIDNGHIYSRNSFNLEDEFAPRNAYFEAFIQGVNGKQSVFLGIDANTQQLVINQIALKENENTDKLTPYVIVDEENPFDHEELVKNNSKVTPIIMNIENLNKSINEDWKELIQNKKEEKVKAVLNKTTNKVKKAIKPYSYDKQIEVLKEFKEHINKACTKASPETLDDFNQNIDNQIEFIKKQKEMIGGNTFENEEFTKLEESLLAQNVHEDNCYMHEQIDDIDKRIAVLKVELKGYESKYETEEERFQDENIVRLDYEINKLLKIKAYQQNKIQTVTEEHVQGK